MTSTHQPIDLTALFTPNAVAIVGASDDPEKIAGKPLAAMLAFDFKGAVYPVNARREVVQGQKAYPSLSALPEVPDLVVIAVPSSAVHDTVAECTALGVKYAVVFAGGFAEVGEAGRAAQIAMAETARAGGLRILGPNCLGAMDFNSHVYATFTRATDESYVPGTRGLAVVSQSGALGNYMLTQAMDQGLPIIKWVTTGNESDLEFAEVLQALAHDSDVTGILAYQEGARDGPRLIRALNDAREQKTPVCIIKVGATEVGAKAVVSHTDALAGDDAAYDALFTETGALRLDSIEHMLDVGNAVAQTQPAKGNKVLIATISGGVGVIMAEAAVRADLELPDISDSSKQTLKESLPFMSANNPLDVTGQVVQDFGLLQTALDLGVKDTSADIVLAFIGRLARVPAALEQYVTTLSALGKQYPDTRFVTVGMFDPETSRQLQSQGLLVYSDPSRAVRAASALAAFGQAFRKPSVATVDLEPYRREPMAQTPNEAACYALLESIGIQTPTHHTAQSADDAIKRFGQIGGDVVMKVLSSDLAHKSDVGGVHVGLSDLASVGSAFTSMMKSVTTQAPGAAIDGVLLAQMTPIDVELVLGARVDPQLGPVVMVGAGGVLVEIIEDVQVATAPLSVGDASALIGRLKSAKMLGQWRGRAALDIQATAQALSALSYLIAANAHWISSIEINPFVPGREGEPSFALDCALQLTTSENK